MTRALALLAAFVVLAPSAAFAAPRAFRITDLDLRDPHTFVSFLGCRDITDTALSGYSFNGDLQTRIQTDTNSDSRLDDSWVFVWDSLDPAGTGGPVRFEPVSCTAPLGSTSCTLEAGADVLHLTSTQSISATCLSALAGTVRPYSPAITNAALPCFVTDPHDLTLAFSSGIVLPLHSAQFGATFVGNPATSLANGLLRGFLTESDADNTILPASMPLFGGQPLSFLFPGGDPPGPNNTNCASYSDKDVGPGGESGWWVYFNFVATEVPYTEATVSVAEAPAGPARLEVSPNPARGFATIRFERPRGGGLDLAIYDLGGRRVRTMFQGESASGSREFRWDGRDADGVPVASGVFFVRALGAGAPQVRRLVFSR